MEFIKQVSNLFTEDYCNDFIKKFESLNLTPEVNPYNFGGRHQEFRHFCKYDLLESIEKEICLSVDQEIKKYVDQFKTFYPYKSKLEGCALIKLSKNTLLPIHFDPPNSGEMRRHFTVLLYLHDCEGGELYFPMQKEFIKPEAGKLLIFPASFTYPHIVIPCTNKDRYTYRFNYIIEDL